MKKYLFFISIILLSSCSTDESSSKSQIQNHKADFTLSKNTERVDWNNIQTGEILKFDVKIKDFDTSPDVQYVLKPITTDATKHQRNKQDYNFQEEIKVAASGDGSSAKDSILIKKTKDSIIIKRPNSSFFVSILKPGNFTQQYELRKMSANKYVAGFSQEILFSAVKIEVYTWNEQTDNSTLFSNSKHSRYYEFTIDDGDQTNDTYLTDSDSKENTYIALYNGNKYNGSISINKAMTFSGKVDTQKSPQVVPNWILSELKIIQKRNHEPDNIITYHNLNLIQK
ncbi:hypothetical protein [Flavobacterium sp. ENC]|uniref:hypothetical protein n=1 Tax=Flavobacterium sp. ENC TaxID=2897330 RepID=UPI001E42BD67|nr:hypothetical protein [Flavobacterium sp. ENC]MCD0467918.1 hypothetical protein [Flavobacterium sp. ENC]